VVREVMTPRIRIVAAPESASAGELAELVMTTGYTRIPLYRGTLDEIIGMVHAFDLIKAGPDGPVRVRPVAAIPASRRCADALLDLKREGRHLAVALDEFGGTAGLLTMEDLLEELVGEIFDELDERAAARPAVSASPGVLVVDASFPITKLNEHFGTQIVPPARVETAGGYLAWGAGRIPQPGERLVVSGLEFDVLEGTAARVGRVVIRLAAAPAPTSTPPPTS
jgi:magnesium and cobalt transporter